MELTISLAQMDVITAEPEKNLEKGESFLKEASKRGSDMIVFPEMWTTGFNWKYNKEIAESHEKTNEHIGELAKKYGLWILGSTLALNEEGDVSNTSIFFNPDGRQVALYRKVHLFSLVGEEKHMTRGDRLTTADTPWGKCGLSICYDLRFPELFRSYACQGAKMIYLPSAFPNPRRDHWRILLRARAIENQLFMIAVNQVGTSDLASEKEPVTFFGTSMLIDPWGKVLLEGDEEDETLLTATIDTSLSDEIREKMTVLQDRQPAVYQLG